MLIHFTPLYMLLHGVFDVLHIFGNNVKLKTTDLWQYALNNDTNIYITVPYNRPAFFEGFQISEKTGFWLLKEGFWGTKRLAFLEH